MAGFRRGMRSNYVSFEWFARAASILPQLNDDDTTKSFLIIN